MPTEEKTTEIIDVRLIAETNQPPEDLASYAARTCYLSKEPKWGTPFDVKEKLFKVGHHSTLEHTYFTFYLEGIAVGDVTFGLHLTTPYYDTDQRSGRYAKLFDNYEFTEIEKYIKNLYPEITAETMAKIKTYVDYGFSIYNQNIAPGAEKCVEYLKAERPYLTQGYIDGAPKFAQEQLRNFIPGIVPTALLYTIDLATLFGLYSSSWSPAMRFLTDKMVGQVLQNHPEIAYMFDAKERLNENFAPKILENSAKVENEPKLKLLDVSFFDDIVVPTKGEKNPMDQTTTSPKFMNNETANIATEIEISYAVMGQDQRHRSYRRSQPEFTGKFYIPPIPAGLGLESEAEKLMKMWFDLVPELPENLSATIAPFGATLKYKKRGNFNALSHEMGKRLCFCAQQEIYELGVLLRREVEKLAEKDKKYEKVLGLIVPPCMTGTCAEPARYCGRDIGLRTRGDYFPKRLV